jgi:glycosyltransferase involved in cell wall biosynthesis
MSSTPLVSICCTTYNHAPFIRHALDGFLAQRVDFPLEILINDDASTDGTPDILREYERAHPELFRVVYQAENQFSRGVRPMLDLLFPRASGKYLALCEGDDYWTDPEKLRKQVGYLEAHPDCTVVSGGYVILEDGQARPDIISPPPGRELATDPPGFAFGFDEMRHRWMTKTLTSVIRKAALPEGWAAPYRYVRDVHIFYHLIKAGSGFYITEPLGVYNVHAGGIHSAKHGVVNKTVAYRCRKELHLRNRDDFTRSHYLKACTRLASHLLQHGESIDDAISPGRLLREALPLVRSRREARSLLEPFVRRARARIGV